MLFGVRRIDDGVQRPAEEVVVRRQEEQERPDHVVKQALVVFVLAVLVVAVPAPFVAEVALEPGDEAKRVVLRRIAGRKQIRRVIAA